jgi:hypothetical protein
MKLLPVLALSGATFAAGLLTGPGAWELAAKLKPESHPQCLARTRICVGKALPVGAAAGSGLMFVGAICVNPIQGSYRYLVFPEFLRRLCPGGVASVDFSRPGRFYNIQLRDGVVTGINDLPDVTYP